jgi:hypothetical protein
MEFTMSTLDKASYTEEYWVRKILENISKDPTNIPDLTKALLQFGPKGSADFAENERMHANFQSGYFKAIKILTDGIPLEGLPTRGTVNGVSITAAEGIIAARYDWAAPTRRKVPLKASEIIAELNLIDVPSTAVVGLVLKGYIAKGTVKAVKPSWLHASFSYFMPPLKDGTSKKVEPPMRSFGKPVSSTGGFKPSFTKLDAEVGAGTPKTLFNYSMPQGSTNKDALELYDLLAKMLTTTDATCNLSLSISGDTKSLSITRS